MTSALDNFADIRAAMVTRFGAISTTGGAYPIKVADVVYEPAPPLATDRLPRVIIGLPDGKMTLSARFGGWYRASVTYTVTVELMAGSTSDRVELAMQGLAAIVKSVYTDEWWTNKAKGGTAIGEPSVAIQDLAAEGPAGAIVRVAIPLTVTVDFQRSAT